MTSSETRALRHAALLVLGLGLVRVAAESVRSPVTTRGATVPDSSGVAGLLEELRENIAKKSLPYALREIAGGYQLTTNPEYEHEHGLSP